MEVERRRPRRRDRDRGADPGRVPRVRRAATGDRALTSLARVYREEWGRAVAILTRVLGDLQLAEDAVQDAFTIALERWQRDGEPANPGAWIVTTARNRAIDRLRREQTFARKAELLARLEALPAEEDDVSSIPDDRLALVFTCCHPALAAEARDRADAARGRRPDDGRDRPRVPRRRARDGAAARAREAEDPRRRHPVPRAAGRAAARAAALGARRALPRLQRGLLGHGGRRGRARRALRGGDPAREAPRGADAGRGRGARPARADAPPRRAPRGADGARRHDRPARRPGSLALEPRPDRRGDARARARALPPQPRARTRSRRRSRRCTSDGRDRLGADRGALRGARRLDRSPVVALNHAVAVAMADGPERGLELVERIDLPEYHLLHAARADLLRRLGRNEEAAAAYRDGARARDERRRPRRSSSGGSPK